MMQRPCSILLPLILTVSSALAADSDSSLEALMEQAEIPATVSERGEGALLDESTAVEQARIKARTRSDYGLELRPGISDNDASLALRIYMPDRWSKSRLREQLVLAARSEQLRVAALEWEDILSVYRDFSNYRMLLAQLERIENEQRFIEPVLTRMDHSVEMNQSTSSERARIYSIYLGLVNEHAGIEAKLTETKYRLKSMLGPRADLENLSVIAVIQMPSQLEVKSLLQRAITQRSDIQQMIVDYRSLQLAEEVARSESGYRLKYLQPAYKVDYKDGSTGWEVSAAIILPWGTRNPDIAVYQSQQALTLKSMAERQRETESSLTVLLETAEAYYDQASTYNRQIKPLKKQLQQDLSLMENLPLDQMRIALSIRSRLLETEMVEIESRFRMENVAIDLAEELGSL